MFKVPPEILWNDIINHFIWSIGYEWIGTAYPNEDKIEDANGIDGFHLACVPTKNTDDREKCHAVIINKSGLVVHDPAKDQDWKGINIIESGAVNWWSLIEKRSENP